MQLDNLFVFADRRIHIAAHFQFDPCQKRSGIDMLRIQSDCFSRCSLGSAGIPRSKQCHTEKQMQISVAGIFRQQLFKFCLSFAGFTVSQVAARLLPSRVVAR
jgi:hypothetical protein